MQGTEVTPKSAALLRQRLVRFWRAKRVPLVGLLLALLALGSWIVWQFPSVLRTGNREPTPAGGEISGLATVCRGAVEAGYCARPVLIAHELQVRPFEIIEGHVTATGATRPRRLLIRVRRADGSYVRYRAKWRQVPDSLEESNNSPRRELASYAIQRLLFEPERYVVVPTVLRCLPLTKLAALGEGSAFPGAQCVLGLMSHWLEDAREFDMGLIESANPSFAQRIGDLNAFGYVTAHRDAIGANFLMLGEPPLRVFVVDSGMTFGAWEYNPLGVVGSVWMSWKAQAIHPSTLRRLRGLTRRDLAVLRTVAQLELDANGVYRSVPDSEPWQDVAEELPGVRRRGGGIQLGLTPAELDETYEQTRELLAEL